MLRNLTNLIFAKGLWTATGSTTSTAIMGKWVEKIFFENELETKILAAVTVTVVLGLIVIKTFPGSKSRANLPPGPLNLPVVGAMFSVEANIGEWYKKMAKKFGKIFYFRLGSHGILIVGTAEGAEEVLKTKDVVFANRPINAILKSAAKYMAFDCEDILLANYDEAHKNLKKLLTVNVFNLSAQHRFVNMRRREGMFLAEDIQRQINSEGIINVGKSTLDLTVNLLCSLIFGRRYSDSLTSETDQLKHCPDIIRSATDLILKLNLGDIFPWLALVNYQGCTKEFKEYNQLCRRVFGQSIEDHREARRTNKRSTDTDFLDTMLKLHDEGKISENAVLGSLFDMLVGGTDSSAITAEWGILELVTNPDCLTKLQKEMDEVVGKERPVEESDYPKLPYFQAVIHETLRLHPPVPLLVSHFSAEATTVQGFFVPANTTVFVYVELIARDPLNWEDPEKFNPERFMNSKEKINITEGNLFSLLPFGSGRRKCPAAPMGLLTVQRVIATLAHAFDWSPLPGKTIDDIDKAEVITTLSRPATPLLLRAKPRLNPAIYSQSQA